MLCSYIASTLYHALPAWSVGKERLRKWDHAAIYWHIAGSYTPSRSSACASRDYGAGDNIRVKSFACVAKNRYLCRTTTTHNDL